MFVPFKVTAFPLDVPDALIDQLAYGVALNPSSRGVTGVPDRPDVSLPGVAGGSDGCSKRSSAEN